VVWPLPFTLKSSLRQKKKKKKNYGNSNISPCKNINKIFKKKSSKKKKTKFLQDIIIITL
jgi:hypothetical protein